LAGLVAGEVAVAQKGRAENMSPEPRFESATWRELWPDDPNRRLERALPAFLRRQRWFGGKARTIDGVLVRDAALLPDLDAALFLVDVRYSEGEDDTYFVPLVRLPAALAETRVADFPQTRLAEAGDGEGGLFDATVAPAFCQWLLRVVREGIRVPLLVGSFVGRPAASSARRLDAGMEPLPAWRSSAEQSNTSVHFGDRLILKVFRRLQPGPNPDCEVTSYLTRERGNTHVPDFLGSLHYAPDAGEELTLGLLQTQVANQGDGWSWTLAALDRYYDACAGRSFPTAWRSLLAEPLLSLDREDLPGSVLEVNAGYLTATATLARRTAEMHLDLAAATAHPAFQARPMQQSELGAMAQHLRQRALRILDQLAENRAVLPEGAAVRATSLLARREQLLARFRELERLDAPITLARVHGDYHLGQILRTGDDFVILDFEGEPTRPLAERRSLQSPLKDVAGMLRSYGYSANVAHANVLRSRAPEASLASEWASLWELSVSTVFLGTYRAAVADAHLIPERDADLERLLAAFLLDKAFYELDYELNNRPAWVPIPLAAISELCRDSRTERQPWRNDGAEAPSSRESGPGAGGREGGMGP
jgi:maltose alpha-D-glucosyltransferase/alpha-amylase